MNHHKSASRRAGRPAYLLSRSLEEKLAAYILSAGAGVLAVAQPATAQIVYTPTYEVIHEDRVAIDLNHDGRKDFKFQQSTSGLDGGRSANAAALNSEAKLLAGTLRHEFFAARLNSGSTIGGSRKDWFRYGRFASEYAGYTAGPWRDTKDGYLGLRLIVNGQDHYGWARFSVQPGVGKILLTGYAYNTVPNQPIQAGQTDAGVLRADGSGTPRAARSANSASVSNPAALGVLALGSLGLGFWRSQ